MNIINRVRTVESLFLELDTEIAKFMASSGLACKKDCGECCLYPEVYATPLEFLPFAFQIFSKGKPEAFMVQLDKPESDKMHCILYNPLLFSTHGGGCSDYQRRGLICRLFGFSTRHKKDATLTMITCKIIKENFPAFFSDEAQSLSTLKHIPVAADFYTRLSNIDFELGGQSFPVNLAIKKAIEAVAAYYAYRKMPGNT